MRIKIDLILFIIFLFLILIAGLFRADLLDDFDFLLCFLVVYFIFICCCFTVANLLFSKLNCLVQKKFGLKWRLRREFESLLEIYLLCPFWKFGGGLHC